MSTVITVENLGKKYTISHQQREEYSSLRDVITNSVASLGKKLIHPFRSSLAPCPLPHDPASEDFWALKDVSFEVKQGDRIGIIGRNGAGKSTLLKILSRITEPTTGSIRIKGRVASLLEVGTGFHPELTGRENIFLNGAILGMQREEIRRKFDEIVDFAEIEKFLDTPVKRYSSGMYVRLAFAVAAHLEPEILIVDEVLAVGDAQFQKKCLGKMEDVGREGRTVIFVSHNMGVISQLCNMGIFLHAGFLKLNSSADDCIKTYLSENRQSRSKISSKRNPHANQKLLIKTISIENHGAGSDGVLDNRNPTFLKIVVDVYVPGSSYSISVELLNDTDAVILCSSSLDLRPGKDLGDYSSKGEYFAELKLPTDWLLAGSYSIRVAAAIPAVEVLDIFPEELSFILHDSCSPVAILGEGRRGVVVPRLEWTITRIVDTQDLT